MIHPVYVYYDKTGNVSEWVVSDDDSYQPSERPGMVQVSILRKDYDTLPPDPNINGIACQNGMNKACLPELLKIDPALAAKVQSNIDTVDTILAQPAPVVLDS